MICEHKGALEHYLNSCKLRVPLLNEKLASFSFFPSTSSSPSHSVLGRVVLQWQARLSPADTTHTDSIQLAHVTGRQTRLFLSQVLTSREAQCGDTEPGLHFLKVL